MTKKIFKRTMRQSFKVLAAIVLLIPILITTNKFDKPAVAASQSNIGDLSSFFSTPQQNSNVNGNVVNIVPDASWQKGAIWTKNKIGFDQSFTIESEMLLGGNTSAADGIALAFQPQSNTRIADAGGALNIYGGSLPPTNMIVAEFDTYNNGYNDYGDSLSKEFNIVTLIGDKMPNSAGKNPRTQVEASTAIPLSSLTSPIGVIVKWNAASRTLTITADGMSPLSVTYSEADLDLLFGPTHETYFGYTGSTGTWGGAFYTKFIKFSLDSYDLRNTQTIYHADGAPVTDANPAHKNETLHVKEVLVNNATTSDTFHVKYSLSSASNLNTMGISNFKINGSTTAYAPDTPLALSSNTPITVEYDIPVQQGSPVFTDASSSQKINWVTQITSSIGIPELFQSDNVATANDAPTWGAGANAAIEIGSAPNYVLATGITAVDREDTTVTSRITANSSAVNTNVLGVYPVVFSVTDFDGKPATTTVTKLVAVTPVGEVVDAEKPFIYAPNRVITKGTAINLTDGMYAFDRKDGDLTSAAAASLVVAGPNGETTFDNNVIGKWELTFSVTDSDLNTTTRVADLFVVNTITGDIGISAVPFTINVSEVAGLTGASVISKANAKAWQVSTGSATSVSADYSRILPVVGSYDVIFTSGTASYTVKAKVVADGTVISPDGKNTVYAENIVVDQAKAMTLVDEAALRNVNKVMATIGDLTATANVTIAPADWNAIKLGTIGSYNVTYSVGTSGQDDYAVKTVTITVVKDGVIVSPDGKNTMYAKNVVVSQTDAKALIDEAALRTANKVVATINGTSATANVTIAPADWSAIKNGDIGSYDVTYSVGTSGQNDYAANTVKVTVLADGVVISPDGNNGVYAENVVVDQTKAKTLIDEVALRDVNNVAASVDGAEALANVTITPADWSAIKAGTVGTYSVTYFVGTSGQNDYAAKTVKITVLQDGVVISPDKKNGVYAESVVVDQTKARTLTDEAALRTVNKVIASIDGATAAANVTIAPADWSAIKAGTTGSYDVTYYVGTSGQDDYAAKTVKISVLPDGTVNSPDEKNSVYAENVVVNQTKAGALTDEAALRTVSKVIASINGVTTEGATAAANVTIAPADWDAIKAGTIGSYNVTYSVGTSGQGDYAAKTVKITVIANGVVISPNEKNGVYAESITVDQTKAKTLSDEAALRTVNRVVASIDGASAVANVTIAPADWDAIKNGDIGSYNVTYYVGTSGQEDYAAKQVEITVVADGVVISPDGKNTIRATNVVVDQTKAKTLTDEAALRTVNNVVATVQDLPVAANVTIAPADWDKIKNGDVGSYDVTYNVGTSGQADYAAKTVKITVLADGVVISPDEKSGVYAENVVVDQAKAKTLIDEAALRSVNKVVASVNGTMVAADIMIAPADWSAIKTGTVGSYSVTYTVGTNGQSDYAAKTVKITVLADGVVISPDEKSGIYAENVTVDQTKAKTLIDEAKLRTANKVAATVNGVTTTANVTIAPADWDAIKAGTVGSYDVTYNVGTSGQADYAAKTVKITVSPDGTVISPDEKNSVYAENVVVDQTKAGTLTDEAALRVVNKVVATINGTTTEGATAAANVTIAPADWDAIKAGTVGSYNVTYYVGTSGQNDYAAITVKITVLPDGTVISPDEKNSVYAENVVVDQTKASTLTDEAALRTVSKVIATINGTTTEGATAAANVTIAPIDWDAIKAGTVGSYDVTYYVGASGQSDYAAKTVKITVLPDGTVISPDEKNSVYAENVVVNQTKAGTLTDEAALRTVNKVIASINGVTTEGATAAANVTIAPADWDAIKAGTVGSYNVTYSVGTSGQDDYAVKTVKITVVLDGSVISPDESTSLYAESIEMALAEANALTGKNGLLSATNASVKFGDGTTTNPNLPDADYDAVKNATVPGAVTLHYTYGTGAGAVSKDVIVTIIDDGTYTGITGQNGVLTISQAKALANKEALATTNVVMVTIGDGSHPAPTVATASWADINAGTIGIYNVDYEYGPIKQTYKVSVVPDGSVISPDGVNSVYAQNTIVDKATAQTLTTEAAIRTATKEHSTNDGVVVGARLEIDIADWTNIKAGNEGVYQVTYSLGTSGSNDFVTKSVNITVKDHIIIDPANKENIGANDFMLSKDQVTTITDTELISLAKAEAVDTETGNAVAIKSVDKALLKPEVGVYEVTFATAKGTSVTVEATVKDNVVIDPANKEAIGANNFMLSKDQVATITDAELISLAKAAAVDTETGKAVAVTKVNKAALQPAIGEYNVTFATAKGTSVTVKATVKDNVIIDPTNKEAIGASNFMLSKDQVNTVTDVELISLAKAEAVDTETGATVAVTKVDKSALQAVAGEYNVTFATEKGTSVTVKAKVKDHVIVDPSTKEAIGANDFMLSKDKVAMISEAELISLAQAEAFDTETGAKVEIATVMTTLQANPGIYDVTFATAKKTSVTVKATVKDAVVIDPTKKEAIGANNFMLAKDQVETVTNAELISLAKAEAFNTETGAAVAVTIVDKSALQPVAGVYHVTFATAQETSVTVVATVKDNVITDPSNKESIGANNFMISKDQVNTITKDELIALAKAKAVDTETGAAVAVTKVDKSALKPIAGEYNVTFATEKGTSVTVKATVKDNVIIDPSKKEAIGANNFMISKDHVATVTDAELISLAKAEASDTVTGAPVAVTKVNRTALQAVVGEYDVTFATAKGTSVTVKATVKDNVIIDPSKKEAIGANNFMISKDQVAAITDAELINLARAKAVDTETGAVVAVTKVDKSALKPAAGEYNVTFATEKGTSVTVKATVKDNVIIDPSKKEAIGANNFMISKDKVTTVTDAELITLAKAKAVNTETGANVEITRISTALQANPGVYDVTFATAQGTSVTVKAIVKDHVVIDPTKKEAIGANNFMLAKDQVETVTNAELISLAKAEAFDTETGASVAVTIVDKTALRAAVGEYNVTFATAQETSVTVVATVKDNVITDPSKKESIGANNFMLSKDQVNTITKVELIALAKAKAVDTETGAAVAITKVDKTALKPAAGEYNVTFATAKGTSVTVKATVKDNVIIDPSKKEAIGANNFMISKDHVATVTDAELISLAKAKAIDTVTGAPVAVTKVNKSALQAVVGEYAVTFATAKGTSVTVKATVKDNVIIDPSKKEAIGANNFMISKDQVAAITDEKLISLAKAKAVDTETGASVAVTKVDRTALKPVAGEYDVTFATEQGTSVTVKATVKDNVIIDPSKKEAIGANDFMISKDQVATVTDAELIALAKAKAVNTETGAPIAVASVDRSALQEVTGVYNVTFATANKTSVTVKATVKDHVIIDPTKKEAIGANNFMLAKGQVETVTNAELISLAKAEAFNTETGAPVAVTIVDKSALRAAVGEYNVTFATAQETSVTVVATVKDNVITDPSNKESIGANNFMLSKDQVAAITDAKLISLAKQVAAITDTELISLAKAEAFNTETGAAVAVTKVDKSALVAEAGEYNVTFATEKGTSVTVKATVKDNVIIDPSKKEAIGANNFMISKDHVTTVTDAELISLANAEAIDIVTGAPVAVTKVNRTALQALVGEYDVTFATAKGTSVTVKATVKDNVIIDPSKKEAIGANNFMLSKDQVAAITDAELINLARAKAVDTETGTAVAVTKVDKSALKPAAGEYNVTFATEKGTSVTVKATVKDNVIIDPSKKEAIGANNFMLSKDQVATVTDAELINLAKAEAFNTETGASVAVAEVDRSALRAATGVYNVTFATAKETSVTVKATVKDHVIIDPAKKEAIGANDFIISKDQVATVTVTELINLAKAEAFDTETGAAVAVVMVDKSALKAAIGVYDVTFATAKETSVTVKATVKDKVIIDPTNKEIISANDFVINDTQVATITNAEVINLAKAEAFDSETGAKVEIESVDMTAVQSKSGVYPVTFKTAKRTSVTVNATVIDTIAPNPPVINPIEPGGTTITGTGEPGATVTVTLPDGSSVSTIVNPDGTWTVVSPNPLRPGEKVTATQTDPSGNTSEPASATVPSRPAQEKFLKMPDKVNVKTGDILNYTISGFGNPASSSVEDYRIGDTPKSKGLSFVSAVVPAFTNGTGIKYDIVYSTNKSNEITLHEGISAEQEYSFKAPALTDGEYITSIELRFGTVPADFGLGNKIVFTFKVLKSSPGEILVNKGYYSFILDGVKHEQVSEGTVTDGSIVIPKTSDTARSMLPIFIIALAVMANSRKRRSN